METISLNGIWQVRFPDGACQALPVPGCFDRYTQRKDLAEPVDYETSFSVSPRQQMHYFLRFGAVSYACEVFVNGRPASSHEGMWDAFLLDITHLVQPGENRLLVRVVKPGYDSGDRYPVREVLSGFIPDVQYTFGGPWDDVALLESAGPVPEYHYASGDMDGRLRFVCGLFGDVPEPVRLEFSLFAPDGACVLTSGGTFAPGEPVSLAAQVEAPLLWSPAAPNLYSYRAALHCGGETLLLEKKMGFRTVHTDGPRLLLNRQPIFLRGCLHWGYYDDIIIPNPSEAQIRTELEGMQDYGMNTVKHCLYIPREPYLAMADELGMVQSVELPLWLPDVTPQLPERIRREYPRIVRQLAGHPSILITSLGCELNASVDSAILSEMYQLLKAQTDTLVKDNSGSGECYDGIAEEFADFNDYHFYADLPYFEPLLENFTPTWRCRKPWMFGEFCDSDALRDLRQVRERQGLEHLPWESADPHQNPLCKFKPDFTADQFETNFHADDLAEELAEKQFRSTCHSMVHRKTALEMTRAEKMISGYNITSLRDVPLCANGLFDDFGQPKYDQVVFRQSNDDLVLCPGWDLTRIWIGADRVQNRERYNFTGGASYGLHVLLSNFGGQTMENVTLRYQLVQGGQTLLQGELAAENAVVPGDVDELACLRLRLPEVSAPVSCTLQVQAEGCGQTVENQWPVFLYPPRRKPGLRVGVLDAAGQFDGVETLLDVVRLTDGAPVTGCDAVLTARLTPEVLSYAAAGGHVVLVQRGQGSLPVRSCPFWREGMVWRGYPSFLSQLPCDSWMDDLRFFSVTTDTALEFSQFPPELLQDYRPVMRRYDCRNWTAQDYIARIGYGAGRIYATTLRLEGGQGKQPLLLPNNLLGTYLLDAMLQAD